jgi:hypothetical protein
MAIHDAKMRPRVELWTSLEVKPPQITDLVHVFTQATKDPNAIAPDIGRVIEAADKAPCLGPRERLEIKVADVVQHIVVLASDATNDEQLIFVKHRGVSCSALGNRARYQRLCPMRSLQVEYDEVGQVGSMLVLAAKD